MSRLWIACGFLVMGSAAAWSAEPPAVLTARLLRPDEQCARILDLFRGARSPHPAAALAAWRRATGRNLNKGTEALVAVFNPAMIPELKTMDGATLVLRLDPADGHVRWSATVPRDDGTFAALATALALTDGAADTPVGAVPVDRLGPLGAPLMARQGERLILAGGRDDLQAALKLPPWNGTPNPTPGLFLRLEPGGLGTAGPVALRRTAEALRALGCRDALARAVVEDDAFAVEVTARVDDPADTAAIDPRWLDWAPADSALAAIACTVDSRPEAWDRAFALADRVERADPARAGVAPLRTRLNLLAVAAKVRPEVDLWPLIRGVTVCALADQGEITGALVALHTADDAAAARLAETTLPRLLASRTQPDENAKPASAGRSLGRISGRPVGVAQRGATVVLGWGETALARGLDTYDHPERSAGRLVSAAWGGPAPPRAGILWPGRVRGLSGTTLALADVPPVLWWGRNEGRQTRDAIRWAGLRGLVRRFLDRLPLDPPPDH
ncbi:MAG: hypothetical protein P4L84_09810 [Isosphaeraceae bacterium]|nr:hypothetical protein [Isosphaeraceae bacterium]